MDTKLTIKPEQNIIEKAKDYARLHKTSLSAIIENYLQKITNDNEEKEKITPLVKSLSGIVELPKDFDDKMDYSEFLVNKYK
ncbi:MAG: DUF6364 family protein [Segetibacter sp.]